VPRRPPLPLVAAALTLAGFPVGLLANALAGSSTDARAASPPLLVVPSQSFSPRQLPAVARQDAPPAVPKDCDVPGAIALWGTCDPIPRTRDAWDRAVVDGRAGFLEAVAHPRARLRIDGRDYGIAVVGGATVTRVPITPGEHEIDFVNDENVLGARRHVVVAAGQTTRVDVEFLDAMPKPTEVGGKWYAGQEHGRPLFRNYVPDATVWAAGPDGTQPMPDLGKPGTFLDPPADWPKPPPVRTLPPPPPPPPRTRTLPPYGPRDWSCPPRGAPCVPR